VTNTSCPRSNYNYSSSRVYTEILITAVSNVIEENKREEVATVYVCKADSDTGGHAYDLFVYIHRQRFRSEGDVFAGLPSGRPLSVNTYFA